MIFYCEQNKRVGGLTIMFIDISIFWKQFFNQKTEFLLCKHNSYYHVDKLLSS